MKLQSRIYSFCLLVFLISIIAVSCDSPSGSSSSGGGGGGDSLDFGIPDNAGFGEWTSVNQPTGYEVSDNTNFIFTCSTETVCLGSKAATLTWTTSDNRDLRWVSNRAGTAGTKYTFHSWIYDNDPQGQGRPFIQFKDSLGTQLAVNYGGSYSSDLTVWQELTVSAGAPANTEFLNGGVRCYDSGVFTSATIYTDNWAITKSFPFDITDGVPDSDSYLASGSTSTTNIQTGINDWGLLYTSTQKASSLDRFLYIWIGGTGSTNISPPWSKSGSVTGPVAGGYLLALLMEESNSYMEWQIYNPGTSSWSTVSSGTSTCSGSEYCEGTIDLISNLSYTNASELPEYFHYAAVNYGSADGQGPQNTSQQPASTNNDSTIDSDETASVHRFVFLCGKVLPE